MTSDVWKLPNEGKQFEIPLLGLQLQILYDMRGEEGAFHKVRMCKLVYKHEEAEHLQEVELGLEKEALKMDMIFIRFSYKWNA